MKNLKKINRILKKITAMFLLLQINYFYVFLDRFDVLMLKINF
jgi:hypothetical protein